MKIISEVKIDTPIFIYIRFENNFERDITLTGWFIKNKSETIYSYPKQHKRLQAGYSNVEQIYLGKPYKALNPHESYTLELEYEQNKIKRTDKMDFTYTPAPPNVVRKIDWTWSNWIRDTLSFVLSEKIISLLLLPVWFIMAIMEGGSIDDKIEKYNPDKNKEEKK